MNGTIFDIKEFSIHDGPGGRITVFLKGCPLRCIWCHNPEGLSKIPQVMKKKNLCVNCGRCTAGCNHTECKSFGICIHACANGALSVAGYEISAEALARKIDKNAELLKKLDGGVTFSGGEPLLQADFVCDVADRLKNVHKAIQTSGCADLETYKRVIDKMDFVMQDLKLADCKAHKLYTGVGNENILKNAEYLKKSGKEFVFRVPQIPGITDTAQNLAAISEITKGFPTEYIPYNSLAGAKYDMLGMKYMYDELNLPENCGGKRN